MILPPLVQAPFRYSHRAETRALPALHGVVSATNERHQTKVLWFIAITATVLAALLLR